MASRLRYVTGVSVPCIRSSPDGFTWLRGVGDSASACLPGCRLAPQRGPWLLRKPMSAQNSSAGEALSEWVLKAPASRGVGGLWGHSG